MSLLPVVVRSVVSCRHFLRARRSRKPQVYRQNCSDICHTVGDISTSSLDGHIAISSYLPMSHLYVDTLFEFGVVENFVYRARITVILTSDYFIRLYEAVTMTVCSR